MGCTFVNFTANPIDNANNRSIFFDNASNNALFIPSSSLQFGSSDFTIQFWFKFPGYTNNNGKAIFSDSWGPTNGGFLFYTYQSGGVEKILFYSTSTDGSWNIALEKDLIVSPSFNTWYNVAVTRTGSVFKLYANGQVTNTFSSSLSLRNTGLPYSLGASPTVANASKCSIGSVFIYKDKGLSAAEINQNYHATKKQYLVEENIVSDGLVIYIDPSKNASYPGSNTTIYDLSGSGNNGSLINGPTFYSLNGGSIVFDGTNDVTTFASNPSLTNKITVSVWINPIDNSGFGWIMGREAAYRLLYDSGGFYWVCATTNNSWYTTGTSLASNTFGPYNKWWHVVATYDGTNNRLYINGELQAAGANISGNIVPNGFNLNLMKTDASSPVVYGKGSIGQFQIYNRALSVTEIQQNYNATKNRFVNVLPVVRNGLVLELDAANTASYSGSGNTWYDLSGNGYNYTLTNGPTFSGAGTTSSILFDGSNDRALAINPISLGTIHTVSMIFKSTSALEDGILFGDTAYNNTGYALYINNGSVLYYAVNNFVGASITLTTNWTMFTVTRNGTSVSFYQNGTLLGSQTLGGNNPLTLSSIAAFYGGDYSFQGNISQVSCYNRALSAYEIKQNFDFYRTRYGI
jgi:hypothetical protein